MILPSRYERFGAVVNEALLLGEKVAVSSKAGATILVNDHNGVILDIDKEYIDFAKLSSEIDPIKGKNEEVSNNMPFRYDELMEKLVYWIKSF